MNVDRYTVVFEGDIRALPFNPMKIETPFGRVARVGIGDAFERLDAAETTGEQSVVASAVAASTESTDLNEHHGNVHKSDHSGDGLRPDRPVRPVGGEERPAARPVAPGFYWGRLIAVDPGTADEDEFDPAYTDFEPVEVFENCLDETDPEYLLVSALGIERGQSLDNFEWGAQIPAPEAVL